MAKKPFPQFTDDQLRKLSKEELEEILSYLEEAERQLKFNALGQFKPYPKQREFLKLGGSKLERLLMAGNRVGKTYCGANEMAYHLTGRYPDWWEGRRFNRPIKAWAANDTGLNTRDIVQTKLCGPYGVPALYGSGAIPRDTVDWEKGGVSMSKGVSDAMDTVYIKHVSGGISILTFKSYEQGRKKWQGDAIDVLWFDEEPPPEIYSEGLARMAPVRSGDPRGIAYMTFTPLEGRTEIVLRFLEQESVDRAVVYMTIEDAEHIDAKEREQTIAAYRPHERQARAMGVPLLGSGLVFDIDESIIKEEAVRSLPNHWPKLWGIDFGIGHPFAAVLGAWDRDFDVLHIIHAFRMRDARPIDHARSIRPYGDVPIAYPRDGAQRDKGSGISLAKLYREEGLRMMHEHATWPDGSISTETGIEELRQRMTTGRFKVAAHLNEWWEEFRTYHRKDGQLVKINDDLMSATRILVMMKRFAQVGGRMLRADPNRAAAVARDVDLDLFA